MVHEILKASLPLSAVNGMVAAAAAGDDDDVKSNGEPGALDGLSDVLRAESLTLTSSGSVRLAHWRAPRHDVSAELYAWMNREYARLGPYRRGREGEREQHALTRRAALPLRSADERTQAGRTRCVDQPPPAGSLLDRGGGQPVYRRPDRAGD